MNDTMRLTVAVLAAAIALAACSKGNQSGGAGSATGQPSAGAAASMTASSPRAAASSAMAANGAAASDGANVYQTNCSSCHQASGQGMPGTFPPLATNPVVTGNAAGVIHIVKDGLSGAISVKGTAYNGQMPAFGHTLSGSDIAAAITYIRSSWGNTASAVTPAQVAATK